MIFYDTMIESERFFCSRFRMKCVATKKAIINDEKHTPTERSEWNERKRKSTLQFSQAIARIVYSLSIACQNYVGESNIQNTASNVAVRMLATSSTFYVLRIRFSFLFSRSIYFLSGFNCMVFLNAISISLVRACPFLIKLQSSFVSTSFLGLSKISLLWIIRHFFYIILLEGARWQQERWRDKNQLIRNSTFIERVKEFRQSIDYIAAITIGSQIWVSGNSFTACAIQLRFYVESFILCICTVGILHRFGCVSVQHCIWNVLIFVCLPPHLHIFSTSFDSQTVALSFNSSIKQ